MTARGGPQRIHRPDDWSLGGPPPWFAVPEADRVPSLAGIVERVERHTPQFVERELPDIGRRSAVLVPLYDDAGEPTLILTRRSRHMRSHTSELAFPGGRRDPEDVDLVATALREANEEVALAPGDVTIVGELDSFITGGSQSKVTPFVGLLPARPEGLVPNPAEVEKILHVPVRELLLDEVWREEIWHRSGRSHPITFFELVGDTLWGATAAMVRQLLALATAPTG